MPVYHGTTSVLLRGITSSPQGLEMASAPAQSADAGGYARERVRCAISRPSAYPYRGRQRGAFQRRQRGQGPTVAPTEYAIGDLPLLKSLKTATVAPKPPAIS